MCHTKMTTEQPTIFQNNEDIVIKTRYNNIMAIKVSDN